MGAGHRRREGEFGSLQLHHGRPGHVARGQHQYIFEEVTHANRRPACTIGSVTTLNTMAGGRANVEAGLSGLDILATYAWKDVNVNGRGGRSSPDLVTLAFGDSSLPGLMFVPIVLLAVGFVGYTLNDRERFGLHPEVTPHHRPYLRPIRATAGRWWRMRPHGSS